MRMNTRSAAFRFLFGTLALAALACAAPVPAGPAATLTPTMTPTSESTETAEGTPPPAPTGLTPAPGSPPPRDCVPPGNATLPAQPPVFADYVATLQGYLSGGGSIAGLQTALSSWGGLTAEAGGIVADQDLTGDGIAEIVVAVQAPAAQFPDIFPAPPGDLYIYGCVGGSYQTLYGDYSTPDRPTPDIVAVQDLNVNGRAEVVYTTHYCGAHTCMYALQAVEWQPETAVFANLITGATDIPSGAFAIDNQDGGTSEILVEVGLIGSAGAGPQRQHRDTYAWDGAGFTLSRSIITTPVEEWYPIHYLQDGDRLSETGYPAVAVTLYQQVLDLPEPRVLIDESEIPALRAYARYRMMIALVLLGDLAAAQQQYDSLWALYGPHPEEPGAGFASLADAFWGAYSATQHVGRACTAVRQYAEANPASYEALNQFGYANRLYGPVELCPHDE